MRTTIEVFSDVICPWCCIGKRRLEMALDLIGGENAVEVRWQPFQLNPSMPIEGIERKTYRSAKFGSWERSLELDARVAAVGASVGISFAFDQIARTPNTFVAHRLIAYSQTQGKQHELVESLFRAYLTEGRDIGKRQVLCDVAVDAGMERTDVEGFLASDRGAGEVRGGGRARTTARGQRRALFPRRRTGLLVGRRRARDHLGNLEEGGA